MIPLFVLVCRSPHCSHRATKEFVGLTFLVLSQSYIMVFHNWIGILDKVSQTQEEMFLIST